ncbi:hypothetical protein [Frigidibacter sp. MR17.24]|uniref:hypothetical protein n=1 Tax=Frigidibacter sp. MR17.24 TaxID=3127345 RepID=UPI00301301E4
MIGAGNGTGNGTGTGTGSRGGAVAGGRRIEHRIRAVVFDRRQGDRDRLARLLREADLKVDLFEAASLHEVDKLLSVTEIDILFLELLPWDSGLSEALARLPAGAQVAPVVLSDRLDARAVLEALRAGCCDYLLKDELSVDGLRRAVALALARRGAPAETGRPTFLQTALRDALGCLSLQATQDLRAEVMAALVRQGAGLPEVEEIGLFHDLPPAQQAVELCAAGLGELAALRRVRRDPGQAEGGAEVVRLFAS